MSNPIEEIRQQALAKLEGNREVFVPDVGMVKGYVDEAIRTLSDLVARMPKESHYRDYFIGNRRTPDDEIDAWVKAIREEIIARGYGEGLSVEPTSFSNVGDPYYMGHRDDIVRYGFRIKTC